MAGLLLHPLRPAPGRAALLFAALLSAAAFSPAHPGTGIVVDAAGCVYFTDLRQIWRWEPGGRLTAIVSDKHSHGLLLDADGSVMGEHLAFEPASKRWLTSAWRWTREGLTQVLPPSEGFPPSLPQAVGPDGSAYFCKVDNNRRDVSEIWRRGRDGSLELLAGGAYGYADGQGRSARFGGIGALAVGPDGALYVADAPAIRRVAPDGRVSTLARGGLLKPSFAYRVFGGRFGYLMGLAVDGSGNVFVANYGGGKVVKVTPAAAMTTVVASPGSWSPSGVAIARG